MVPVLSAALRYEGGIFADFTVNKQLCWLSVLCHMVWSRLLPPLSCGLFGIKTSV